MTFKFYSVEGMYSVYVYAKYDRHTSTEIEDIANKNFADKKKNKKTNETIYDENFQNFHHKKRTKLYMMKIFKIFIIKKQQSVLSLHKVILFYFLCDFISGR